MSDVTHAHIVSLPARSFALLRFPWQRGQRVFLLERAGMDRPHTTEATMKKITGTLAALLVAACGTQSTDPVQKFRDALPKAETVALGTPQDEGATAGALTAARQPLGETQMAQSEYAVLSYYLALSVNGGVVWVLSTVRYVTAFPPTTYDETSATWGPWIDEQGLNRWKLTVTRNGDAYDWALSAQPGSQPDAAFADLIAGTAYPVDRDHGSGTFTVNFDAQDALDHGALWQKEDYGQLVVNYDNRQNPTVGAVFVGGHKRDGDQDPTNDHLMNAAYGFTDAASGGELQIAFDDLTTTETVALRTRWSAGGAGRGDAHYNGPDGAGGRVDYYESECWAGRSQNFAEVYDSHPLFGDENLCSPFSTASYADISLP